MATARGEVREGMETFIPKLEAAIGPRRCGRVAAVGPQALTALSERKGERV
jgi:hypothetical protein